MAVVDHESMRVGLMAVVVGTNQPRALRLLEPVAFSLHRVSSKYTQDAILEISDSVGVFIHK